mgnify:CR=1 FL=1
MRGLGLNKTITNTPDTDFAHEHGDHGNLCKYIPLKDILIDEDIQRILDAPHCAGIIDGNKFDPALLQCLQCIKNSKGEFISIDGQHTASVLAGLIVAGLLG